MKLITISEVAELWRCHWTMVLRLIRRGQLHPVAVDGDRFDRAEVLPLKNRKIAIYPHFTVSK